MKRLVVAAAVVVGVVGMAMVAGAFTDITNTATSTYQITGNSEVASGLDAAIVRVLTAPAIVVAKFAKNQRTGIEDANMVQAVSADVIQFRVTFTNTGEADADTVVLRDYIPAGLTAGAVLSNTATAGVTVQAESYSGAGLVATYNDVGGTVAGQDDGQVVFTMTVD